MGFSIPVSNFPLVARGGGQSGQGLLVLPPRCEIFQVRTLGLRLKNVGSIGHLFIGDL